MHPSGQPMKGGPYGAGISPPQVKPDPVVQA